MKTRINAVIIMCIMTCRLFAEDQSSVPNRLFRSIRSGDAVAVQEMLKNGANLAAYNEIGDTPLMAAGWYADASILTLLIDAGADPNVANEKGVTALMRAATFAEKARLLVRAGADVDARSAMGNTALILAARTPGNSKTLELFLTKGADVNAVNHFGGTALMAAVAAEDIRSVHLLIDHGADVNARPDMDRDGILWGGGRTPLMWAAFRNDVPLISLLLARGADVNGITLLGTALTHAAWAGNTDIAKMLIDQGAEVDQRDLLANYTALHWASSSEKLDDSLVNLLLAHGADPNAEGGEPVDSFMGVSQTPIMLALKRGETPIVRSLRLAGARDFDSSPEKKVPPLAHPDLDFRDDSIIADAVRLALPPLHKTSLESKDTFLRHRSQQDCTSCHQQSLPLAAFGLARSRHFEMDEKAIIQSESDMEKFATLNMEVSLQATFHPSPAIQAGYQLFGWRLDHQTSSVSTDVAVHLLCVTQHADGRWAWNLPRPPIQSSDFAATALGLQAIKFYALPGRQSEMDQRVGRALTWLMRAKPQTTEERAYQLLGISWSDEGKGELDSMTGALIQEQREDGGWGQLVHLSSDAYATGQVLYALQVAGVSPNHTAIRKGLEFLLRTQAADGTWWVQRRAFPFQPPMESSFPYGKDGWISATASSWSILALAMSLDASKRPPVPTKTTEEVVPGAEITVAAVRPTFASVDFTRDIQPILERSCLKCHGGDKPKGGFSVVNRASILNGGNRGEPVLVPGKSAASGLIPVVLDQIEDLEMPPLGKREKFPPLTHDETSRLRAWIDQGALWPEGTTLHDISK